jgi:hypothetical protein
MNAEVFETRRVAGNRCILAILPGIGHVLLLGALPNLVAPIARAAPYPEPCIAGYVWREAYPDDQFNPSRAAGMPSQAARSSTR